MWGDSPWEEYVTPRSFGDLQLWHDAQYKGIDVEPAAGYRLNDRSNNNNHGKLQSGRAMTFDGVADYIRIPQFDPTGSSGQYLSTFCWVKGVSQDSKSYLGSYHTTGDERSWLFQFFGAVNSTLRVILSDDGTLSSGHNKQYRSSIVIGDDIWHRIGFTWNAGTLKLYIDGVEDTVITKSVDDPITSIHLSTKDLTIGCHLVADAWWSGFNGEVADVILSDAVWSDADVAYDYNNPEKLVTQRDGTAITAANIKSWHPMIEGADTTNHYIYDSSANGHNGVNVAGGASFLTAQETIPQMAMMGWTLKTLDSVDVYLPERTARDGNDFGGTALTQPRALQMLNMDEAGSVYVTDHASIQNIFDGGGTLMAWIKPASIGVVAGRVFGKLGTAIWTNNSVGNACYLVFSCAFNIVAGAWRIENRDIIFDQYTCIGVDYDSGATENVPTIYINGVSKGIVATYTPEGTRNSDAGAALYIGNIAAGDRAFDGQIDEVVLYSSSLTATQILNYYNTNKSRYGL